MLNERLHGLFRKRTLTAHEVTMIKQLAEVCEQYEQLHMRIDTMMLKCRSGNAINDFLYYEDDLLVGYLALDDRSFPQDELVGMVHPDYRQRGIFRALLDAAIEVGRARNVQQFVLVNEQSSRSGRAFLHSSGAVLSELSMRCSCPRCLSAKPLMSPSSCIKLNNLISTPSSKCYLLVLMIPKR